MILDLKIAGLRAAFFPMFITHLIVRSEATYEAGLRLLDRTIDLEKARDARGTLSS